MQFAGCNIRRRADPKRALEIFVRQGREMDGRGTKGYQFDSNRQVASIHLQMGDVAQAEAYLRKNVALIVEARTSGLPGWRASYPGMGQSWSYRRIPSGYDLRGARTVSRRGSILSACRTTFARRHQITDGEYEESSARRSDFCGRRTSGYGARSHEGATGPVSGSRGRRPQGIAVAAQGPRQV